MRSDGFINTPPEATVVSPQYVIVNRTTQIKIPVSDADTGDTVRCRWSVYTAGSRKRRQGSEYEGFYNERIVNTYRKLTSDGETAHIRRKRKPSPPDPCNTKTCNSYCKNTCPCHCSTCTGTTCSGDTCVAPKSYCPHGTTTVETPGTVPTTISYPNRQPIDECGGICYPSSVPSGTTLSNCTLSFKGMVPDRWYAIAIQVEDFINSTSTTALSSVPVQFLIYVMPEPTCSTSPTIIPLKGCLEVKVGVMKTFNISVVNQCDPTETDITDLFVSNSISGMVAGNLTSSPTNDSLLYVIFTWTPQLSQLGSQILCTIAFTDEQVQSAQYCVSFTVVTSAADCITTTTTTSTTSTTTTTTKTTTTTTTSTSTTSTTSTSTTSTTSTSTTSTTSTSTTSTTSTSTTSTSTSS
ncbi:unnamed protein product, partial [Rotaria sordida]